jgi:hypothetical protein
MLYNQKEPFKSRRIEMTDLQLREKAFALGDLIRDAGVSDEAIIDQIREVPELINARLKTGMNPFAAAVSDNRLSLAKALGEMGADIHWTCAASEGNALNAAQSPQQAEAVLALGVEIEKSAAVKAIQKSRHCGSVRQP